MCVCVQQVKDTSLAKNSYESVPSIISMTVLLRSKPFTRGTSTSGSSEWPRNAISASGFVDLSGFSVYAENLFGGTRFLRKDGFDQMEGPW